MKHWILRFVAWTIFLICVLISMGIIVAIFYISIFIKGANLNKLVLLDAGLVILAIFVFVLGLGALEFVKVNTETSEEVEKLEEEVESLENKPK